MSAVAEQIPSGTWQFDPVHSSVGFAVKHMVVSTFRGRFEDWDASFATVDGEPELRGTVRVDSIEVKDEDLAAHLRAPDFFDTERHPELAFRSTDIRRDGDDAVVDGEFTIKGTTRPIEARGTITGPHEDPFGATRLGIELEAIVDRTEFGLDWNMPLPKGGFALANEVKLLVSLEFVLAG